MNRRVRFSRWRGRTSRGEPDFAGGRFFVGLRPLGGTAFFTQGQLNQIREGRRPIVIRGEQYPDSFAQVTSGGSGPTLAFERLGRGRGNIRAVTVRIEPEGRQAVREIAGEVPAYLFREYARQLRVAVAQREA